MQLFLFANGHQLMVIEKLAFEEKKNIKIYY